MDILNELKNLEGKDSLAGELKKENLPLVLWGSGEIAEETYDYLNQNGIAVNDVFVDDKYYKENEFFKDKKVISYSNLVKKYKAVNVVIGHSNYEKIALLETKKTVNKVFYLFSLSYRLYEKTSVSEIKENIDEFQTVYQILEDKLSRKNYMAFLKTRISGNNTYIFDVFEKECNYFNNDLFQMGNSEVYLDIGAFDGDTVRLFLKETGNKYKYIYAIEPDNKNRSKLIKFIESNDINNISVTGNIPWKDKQELCFKTNENGQLSSLSLEDRVKIEGEKISITADRLDNLFDYQEKVTMLKINFSEGAKEALQGAEKILKRHQPKLAISVGFDCKNIRDILLLVKEVNPHYKLYLRFNRAMVSNLMCYGIV